ncbi:hypothetical protein RHMOL_Rhmol08G0263600 [Rhododendron molle]|uniref:Uncharacterized protein n=1 Tax=Rhododendron molle TaxID=49168 RepID=A0ACC0MSX6_RHOML|nr:hypothetical protein RHMOL_Rhmol08G0263600 [Rhododendron molle]
MLLPRSFLRVKVEINISQPLPKGFWLRGKSGKDLWISYLYERLLDFCYACGRIGHDNRGCRFAPRGAEGQSRYGPELRTGRARKIAVPIEEIVYPEGETRDGAENPSSRRSELQLEDDPGVGGYGTMVERVVNPICQHGKMTKNDVLLETGVNISRESGTKFHNIPISGTQGISDFVSSGFVDSLSGNWSDHLIKPTPATPLMKPGLNVNPIINNSISPTTSPVSPGYFVTEPPDSPKNPHPNSELTPIPLSLTQPLPTPITTTLNPPNITLVQDKPTSPKNLDFTQRILVWRLKGGHGLRGFGVACLKGGNLFRKGPSGMWEMEN